MAHTTKTYLRIKIVSLMAEAKLIRREEKRWIRNGLKNHPIKMGLAAHRRFDVRNEQRAALLAYAFLRGRRYKQLEPKCYLPPNWSKVESLVAKYGGYDTSNPRAVIAEELRVWRGN